MFKQKTFFVVGAGASHEFGLPLGCELKKIITQKVTFEFVHSNVPSVGDKWLSASLDCLVQNQAGPSQADCYRAAEKIRTGLPLAISIDNFIDAHRGDHAVECCGKMAIFQAILEAERKSTLFFEKIENINEIDFSEVDDTWMMSLFRMATEQVARDEISAVFDNISFVSFNYDRCIEHFLETALRSYYGVERDEAQTVVSRVPIIHPYGHLGSLGGGDTSDQLSFGADVQTVGLEQVYGRIRTFTERMNSGDLLEKIGQKFTEADRIVFIGFAYHRQNLELLRFGPVTKSQRVFGTSYGLSDADTQVIKLDIKRLLRASQKHSSFTPVEPIIHNNLKCGELLKSYWRTLSS